MTKAALEAKRLALLAENEALAVKHQRLHSMPYDLAAHRAHRARLKAHTGRIQKYRLHLKQHLAGDRSRSDALTHRGQTSFLTSYAKGGAVRHR